MKELLKMCGDFIAFPISSDDGKKRYILHSVIRSQKYFIGSKKECKAFLRGYMQGRNKCFK